MDSSEIKVSVVVATYNQERYLPHALDSIVSQKVNFKYEVLVGEDCSTDNTADVVRDYAKRFPDIIVPLIREKNLGMAGNAADLISRTKGKYIAFIEGDDYWIDDNKLQKQIDFLDAHQDYVAVFGRCIMVDESDIRLTGLEQYNGFLKRGGDYTVMDFQDYLLPGQTATSVYRKVAYGQLQKKLMDAGVDARILIDRGQILCMMAVGKMYVFEDFLAAYRYVTAPESGSWTSKNDFYSEENLKNYLDGMKLMEQTAEVLGLKLDFDERRIMEIGKLYKNREGLSPDSFKRMKKEIKKGFNSKKKYWKTDALCFLGKGDE